MTAYEQYTFFLCLIVFVSLTALFTALLAYVVRLTVQLIRHGMADERILREYRKNNELKKRVTVGDWIARIFSGVVCVALICAFAFAVMVRVNENDFANRFSTLRVVKSSSMAQKYEKNTYLYDNQLNDQIQMMDLIITDPLPAESELQLYDIVVYEYNGMLVVHRIVEIEEPNKYHPDNRFFRLQGDAVETADRFPVRYEQMRAIYRGVRIPLVGSFIAFMQSPAGFLCILLVLFAVLVTPFVEKKLMREKEARLRLLPGVIVEPEIKKPEPKPAKTPVPQVYVEPKTDRKPKKVRFRKPLVDADVKFDVKGLNVNIETKKGSLFWLHFGVVDQKVPELHCKSKKRDKK